MSTAGVDAAVERICADEQFAGAVVRDGTAALEGGFDLTDDERADIANALRADVEDATGDVEGFIVMPSGSPGFGGIQFNNLSQVASLKGTWDRRANQLVWPGD
jgi:hypothetical protein